MPPEFAAATWLMQVAGSFESQLLGPSVMRIAKLPGCAASCMFESVATFATALPGLLPPPVTKLDSIC